MTAEPELPPLQRLANGTWAPGQSGNQRGRPPTPLAVRKMLAHYQWAALGRLVRNIEYGADAAANTAAQWVLEQHIGKATQPIDASVTDLTAAHLLAVGARSDALGVLELAAEPALDEPPPLEPTPLLDWAGIAAPPQHPPDPIAEFAPLPDRGPDPAKP